MAARALFAGPGALRALLPGRHGTVELVLSGGCYVRLGDDWLLLAEPEVPFGPLSVGVVGLELRGLRPGQPARVERGRLLVGERAVSLERMRERRPAPAPRVGRAAEGSGAVAAGLGARAGRAGEGSGAAFAALGVIGPPPGSLAPGLVALRQGWIDEGVRWLAGRGEGLTPAGDDALAGYAAWRHAVGAPARLAALAHGRSSPLGLAYFRCAERGELPDAGAVLLGALLAGDRRAAAAAARALRDWGASSGAALVWGMGAGASGQAEGTADGPGLDVPGAVEPSTSPAFRPGWLTPQVRSGSHR